MLVGTHKDKVNEPRDHEAISQLLWSNFSSHVQWPFVIPLKEGVVSTGRGLLWFYPVDNTRSTDRSNDGRDPVLGQLIASLEAAIQSCDQLHRLVPFTWMKLYDKLQAELRSGKMLLSIQHLHEVATECELSPSDVSLALHYLDCMGLLLHCADERLHSAAVVLDTTRFLVRAATMVLCQHDIHLESLHLEAAQGHSAHWKELISSGILDSALLPVLWREFEPQTHTTLLSLMHRFGLICPIAPTIADQPPSRFLVPSLLPDDSLSPPPDDACTCFFVFSSGPITVLSDSDTIPLESLSHLFLPAGLFPRVVAKCVEWIQQTSRDKTPLRSMSLKRCEAALSFGPHRCLLQHVPAMNSLRVHILVRNTEVVTSRLETIVLSVIAEAYPKLHATLMLPCNDAKQTDQSDQSDMLLPLQTLRRAVEEKKGLWLGKILASANELSARFAAFLPPQGLLPAYDLFISYRWTPKYGACCNDSDLAIKLFDIVRTYALGVKGRRPEVFLDRHRLEEGRRFDRDFMTAMAHSSIVVPLVSYDALQRMLTILPNTPRPCDNVLLEWCLVTELQEQGRMLCVLPILIGRIEGGCITNLFANDVKDRLPNVICDQEIAKIRDFFSRNGWSESPKLQTLTVRGVVDSICSCLGIMLWDLQPPQGSGLLNSAQFGLYEAAAEKIMQNVERYSDGDGFAILSKGADKGRMADEAQMSADQARTRRSLTGVEISTHQNVQEHAPQRDQEAEQTCADESVRGTGTGFRGREGEDGGEMEGISAAAGKLYLRSELEERAQLAELAEIQRLKAESEMQRVRREVMHVLVQTGSFLKQCRTDEGMSKDEILRFMESRLAMMMDMVALESDPTAVHS